jgi:hypothetical protein
MLQWTMDTVDVGSRERKIGYARGCADWGHWVRSTVFVYVQHAHLVSNLSII